MLSPASWPNSNLGDYVLPPYISSAFSTGTGILCFPFYVVEIFTVSPWGGCILMLGIVITIFVKINIIKM